MSKLTTERLDEIAKLEITEFSDGMDIAKDAYQSVGSSEIVLMARQLLAYEQAAKNPVAWVVGDEEIADFKNGREVCVMRDCDDEQLDYLPLYAEPVLPKQPEPENKIAQIKRQKALAWLKRVAYENPCMKEVKTCIEVLSAPAQPVIPEQQTVQLAPHVYRELVNDLRDVALTYHGAQQLRERISRTLSKAVTLAQPVISKPLDELLDAVQEVLRISDRKHDAWDRTHAAIASVRQGMPAQESE